MAAGLSLSTPTTSAQRWHRRNLSRTGIHERARSRSHFRQPRGSSTPHHGWQLSEPLIVDLVGVSNKLSATFIGRRGSDGGRFRVRSPWRLGFLGPASCLELGACDGRILCAFLPSRLFKTVRHRECLLDPLAALIGMHCWVLFRLRLTSTHRCRSGNNPPVGRHDSTLSTCPLELSKRPRFRKPPLSRQF